MRSPRRPAKFAMLLLSALLLLCRGVGNVHGETKTIHENSVDLHALLDFKKGITNDPRGALSNWNATTTHFCWWNGVICTTTRPFRLSSLNLTAQNLYGQITSSLGNLSFLTQLDLSHNSLFGTVPILNNLQQVKSFYLNNNNLTGINPDALSNCSSLVSLDLSRNLLVGEIPPKLGFLLNLDYINFASNQLEESVPDELGKLTNLLSLQLGDNMLSGEFPPAILNLSSLQSLSLNRNMLGKALPPNIGDRLPVLKKLSLFGNSFEGHIPASLGNALGLVSVDLSSNNFTGQIPSSLGNLSELNILNLDYNQLETTEDQGWEFLNELRNCRSLNVLSLAANQLKGSLPQSIGNLTSLQNLILTENRLSGQVPQSIGKLSALTTLELGANHFTGSMEGWVENLKNLHALNLISNSFSGPITSSIGNLTQLLYLYLGQNKFEGSIPAILGNFSLLELDLSHNNLHGYIPPNFGNLRELITLFLSNNNLQGDIPQISNLKLLTTLDLSSNKLTGQIPNSLGECFSLSSLQLDQNFLAGNIPDTFGNLSSLVMLNLSHNNLSGTIPLALNRLESLNNLDLSYNHLQGVIPRNGVFENATAVSLEGNLGLCGGAMDLHMPLCPASSRRSETQYYLVRVLIPLFGFMSLVMLTYGIITGKKTSRRRTNLFLLSFGKKFPRVSYKDLDRATGSFSEAKLLGRGSYGSVYRGELTQAKIQVAIKVFDLDMNCADKSFVTECDVLRTIRHRNLLPILTACSTVDKNGDDFKALIYEFMPSGNLDTWLHSEFSGGSSKCLSLAQRASIAVGIADALAYLHNDCERQIVHCDLKPTNILLDDDMNAYLGDFGIASLVGHSSSNTSVGLKGTIGYIAPEYAQSGQASIHGDVYSFGIVLLEMMIGKRPTDPMFENELNLVNFAERNYPDQILHITDARLQGEYEGYIQTNITMKNVVYECLLLLMQVALSCTRLIPRERMNIREVANKLYSISTSYIRAINKEEVMLC